MLDSSAQVAVYLRRALPGDLFDALRKLRAERGRGSVDIVVQNVANIDYLGALHDGGMSVYYGVGLPQRTTMVIDRAQAFRLDEEMSLTHWRARPLARGADIYVALLWHRFGLAVSVRGQMKEVDGAKGVFCVRVEGKRINGAGLRIRILRSRRWWGKWSRPLVGKSGTLAS